MRSGVLGWCGGGMGVWCGDSEWGIAVRWCMGGVWVIGGCVGEVWGWGVGVGVRG